MTDAPAGRPSIVVGVDGSEPSLQALDVAIELAARRGSPLHVLHVRPHRDGPDAVTSEALAEAVETRPDLVVEVSTRAGAPATELADAVGPSDVLVVGARGIGVVHAAALGSTSLELVATAPCPVVVVHRDHGAAEGPVVVGLSRHTRPEVVGFAAEEAASRGTELVAVHAWDEPDAATATLRRAPAEVRQGRIEREQSLVVEALAPWVDKFPEVVVHRLVTSGDPGPALLALTDDAGLLVLGRGALEHPRVAVLGSTAAHVLRTARCPVAVVPSR
jgi:nucleotide-binding universal stress UspA family protein